MSPTPSATLRVVPVKGTYNFHVYLCTDLGSFMRVALTAAPVPRSTALRAAKALAKRLGDIEVTQSR